jgi:LemA protein
MKDVIKKLYARELGLIAERSVAARRRYLVWQNLKERIWLRQSTAIKIAAIAAALAFLSALVYYYNEFIVEHYKVRLQRAQIEAELQRRNDLIPALVKVVSDYMSFEGKIFQHAAEVRSTLNTLKNIPDKSPNPNMQSIPDKLPADMQSILSRFQAVAENYPDLKSSVTYQGLMSELSNTETRIAEGRIKYNVAVNYYNARLKMFPGLIFASMLKFQPEMSFESEADAKTVHVVK